MIANRNFYWEENWRSSRLSSRETLDWDLRRIVVCWTFALTNSYFTLLLLKKFAEKSSDPNHLAVRLGLLCHDPLSNGRSLPKGWEGAFDLLVFNSLSNPCLRWSINSDPPAFIRRNWSNARYRVVCDSFAAHTKVSPDTSPRCEQNTCRISACSKVEFVRTNSVEIYHLLCNLFVHTKFGKLKNDTCPSCVHFVRPISALRWFENLHSQSWMESSCRV